MDKEVDYIEVKLRIPKPIHDFLKALVDFTGLDLEELLQTEIRETVRGIIDEIQTAPYIEREELIHRYGIDEVLNP